MKLLKSPRIWLPFLGAIITVLCLLSAEALMGFFNKKRLEKASPTVLWARSFMFNSGGIFFSQVGEDMALAIVFADKLYDRCCYVDVGAYHPSTLSVTQFFYKRGWRGMNIEPIPELWQQFQDHRPEDINLQLAASNKTGVSILYQSDSKEASTLSPERNGLLTNNLGIKSRAITVDLCPLSTLIETHIPGQEIAFLKIDVEGAEREVLEGLDFKKHRPCVILVEARELNTHEKSHSSWEPLLTDAGYLFVFDDQLNRYYIRPESKAQLLPRFEVVRCVFHAMATPNRHYGEPLFFLFDEDVKEGRKGQGELAPLGSPFR